nr:low affinity sulfate transporter 3-like [Tanacetum cinerariifolium]
VCVSFGRLILNAIRPGIEELGRLPGTDIFCDKAQYPGVLDVPGISIIRLNSGSFCFANANPIKEKITKCVTEENVKEVAKKPITGIILDMSSVMSIDSSGIIALEEMYKKLVSRNIDVTPSVSRCLTTANHRQSKMESDPQAKNCWIR